MGVLTALLFTLWPLARTGAGAGGGALSRRCGARRLAARRAMWRRCSRAGALLVGGAVWFSGVWQLALGTAGGVMGALLVLALAAWGVRRGARRQRGASGCAGARALRLALAAIGGPGEEATSVVLSLGLGLTVLAAVGQIDANLRGAIERDLPERAPSYFFVDIQNDQIDGFLARLDGRSGGERRWKARRCCAGSSRRSTGGPRARWRASTGCCGATGA